MIHSGLIKIGGTQLLSFGVVGVLGGAVGAWVVWLAYKRRDHTDEKLAQLHADKKRMQEQLAEMQATMSTTQKPPASAPLFKTPTQATKDTAKLALLKRIVDDNVALQSS